MPGFKQLVTTEYYILVIALGILSFWYTTGNYTLCRKKSIAALQLILLVTTERISTAVILVLHSKQGHSGTEQINSMKNMHFAHQSQLEASNFFC